MCYLNFIATNKNGGIMKFALALVFAVSTSLTFAQSYGDYVNVEIKGKTAETIFNAMTIPGETSEAGVQKEGKDVTCFASSATGNTNCVFTVDKKGEIRAPQFL